MRKLQYLFMMLAVLCFAVPAFADGGSAAINLVPIGAGIGMALAAGLCGRRHSRSQSGADWRWFGYGFGGRLVRLGAGTRRRLGR